MKVKYVALLSFLLYFEVACNTFTENPSPRQFHFTNDSVKKFAESMAQDVSGKGPVEWLQYFKNSPDFFMASDGQLVFPNYDSASNFIKNTLPKKISKIELSWKNIRVDSLAEGLASLSADFHEDITDNTGKKIPEDGYFTSVAQYTIQGWRLCNAHWSTIATK
jgi:hypothetical protein